MLNVAQAFISLLQNAADLEAAVGRTYQTRISEAWNLPADVQRPMLAIDVSGQTDRLVVEVDEPTAFPEELLLRCWYETDTKQEAMQFRDALRAKLHGRANALLSQGVPIRYIWMRDSAVGKVPNAAHFQAYAEFRLVA